MKKTKYKFGLTEIIVIIFSTIILSSFVTGLIMYKTYNFEANYPQMNTDKDLQGFIDIYSTVIDKYYADINKKEMLESAISGMINYLDDKYSTYLTAEEAAALEKQLQGEYKGIGIQIVDGNIVYAVFDNSPAAKAGLKVKDTIIKVEGKDVTKLTPSELATLIKGTTKEKFMITVLRDKKEIDFELSIAKLNIPAIDTQTFEKNGKKIGYIYISTFSSTVGEQVTNAVNKFAKEKIDSLIVDVRYNSGGFLSAAEEISSIFLDKGEVIYYLKDKDGTKVYKDKTKANQQYNIVVLINDTSASASEILAGALKDSYGAVIVGTTSYGKGKVQQTQNLSDGSMIKYTTAQWLRPNKECVDGIGIEPDYKIELKINDKTGEVTDTQLEKAKDLLSK